MRRVAREGGAAITLASTQHSLPALSPAFYGVSDSSSVLLNVGVIAVSACV